MLSRMVDSTPETSAYLDPRANSRQRKDHSRQCRQPTHPEQPCNPTHARHHSATRIVCRCVSVACDCPVSDVRVCTRDPFPPAALPGRRAVRASPTITGISSFSLSPERKRWVGALAAASAQFFASLRINTYHT